MLPAALLEDYGTKTKPRFETLNTVYTKEDEYYLTHGKECDINMDARKLAVRAVTAHFKLSVAFQPYAEGSKVNR